MNEMTASFPPDLQRWIEMRLAEGRYADLADYLRYLVRRDQEGLIAEPEDSPEYIAWVREKVAEGLASPIIDKDPRKIVEEIIARRHAPNG